MGRHDTPSPVVPEIVANAKIESGEDQRKTRAILRDTASFARRFADADQDFDQRLTFDEFLGMMPQNLRDAFAHEEFKIWFAQADKGSGYLTVEEYFLWALYNAVETYDLDALLRAFQWYDPKRSGYIDSVVFSRVCDDTGFGLVSHKIFRFLDPDGNGKVDYHEITSRLTALREAAPKHEKQVLSAIVAAWHEEAKAQRRRVIDTSGWRISGNTVAGVKVQMQRQLEESGYQVRPRPYLHTDLAIPATLSHGPRLPLDRRIGDGPHQEIRRRRRQLSSHRPDGVQPIRAPPLWVLR